MDCGHTQVSRVAIFRTLKTECKASTSHQAIGIIKAVRGAVRERQIVGIYMGITQPAVRYTRTSRGQSANRIRPTKPSRCYPSTPSCRHQPSCRSWQNQDDQQRQQTARYHSSKGTVSGKTVDIHVSTTALVVSIALRVRDCHAKARGIRRWNGINTYLNGVEIVNQTALTRE